MKKTFKRMFYGAVMLAAATTFAACGGEQNNQLTIDGKTHTVSIKEITYEGGYCNITLQMDNELLKKFEEFNNAPFWLGTISGKEYISASGKAVIEDGVLFTVEADGKPHRIVIFTPDKESVVEFDEATQKAVPNPPVKEIADLILSRNPELCNRYEDYQPLATSNNRAGITFDVISAKKRTNTFGMISYSNGMIKSRKDYANEFTSHFYAVDADDTSKPINVTLRGGRSFDNTEFFGIVMFEGNTDAKYALLVFEGVPDTAPQEVITPSFFYVVELGEMYTEDGETYASIKSYCNTPYLTGDILKN